MDHAITHVLDGHKGAFVIDRDGRVVARIAGALNHRKLADIVQPLLENEASATKD